MKILHVPFTYFPDPIGGTEVYVRQLARALGARGVSSEIAAPTEGENARYEIDGRPVHRYHVGTEGTLEEIYGDGSALAARSFQAVLERSRPDLVHLHAFTRGVSRDVARVARRAGCRVVFTYHTVSASCLRGDLLYEGRTACDGLLMVARCAACVLGQRGLPAPADDLLGRMPVSLSHALGRVLPRASMTTALRMPELVSLRHRSFRELIAEVEYIVAVSGWVRALLVRNGVPASKLVLSRHGTTAEPVRRDGPRPRVLPVRVAMLGRLEPSKGAHVLLEALALDPSLPIALDLFAVEESRGAEYATRIRGMVSRETRARLLPSIPPDDVVSTLAGYDLVAAPSQGMETGPLTVLEAFAAGIPVIGSRLGGIAELVRDGVDGLLVPHAEPRKWLDALRRLAFDAGLLDGLRAGIVAPRTMDAVAAEMIALYDSGDVAATPTSTQSEAAAAR